MRRQRSSQLESERFVDVPALAEVPQHDRLTLVAPDLACTICSAALTLGDRVLRCPAGHSFDIARQGYASLVVGGRTPKTGDTQEMVAARAAFLEAEHYEPIADHVAETLPQARLHPDGTVDDSGSPLVVDIAGGTGYYLGRILDARPAWRGFGFDLSPLAARRAARAHGRAAAATADAWAPFPLQAASVDHLLSIFGPRNGPEMRRVLRPDGLLTVVTPQPGHLAELRDRLGMIGIAERKDARLDAQLDGFTLRSRDTLDYAVELMPEEVRDEVRMGPSAHHLDDDVFEQAIADLPGYTTVTVAVTLSVFAPA
ncbi:methyltransferase type 11 [Plantibacter sp. MCCC 1A11337]|uniref:putative RNA methyltransferase n=1 Tax=Plantibacter sp. MCCC 1A11337 TaxID=2736644 RepID=UPI0015836A99|nr:methyltransferase type 11 [Plantibacter sp. MCCC 1A11337]NUJ89752.1 methyltransferase type 11 [Plantibacter sp. MCCC 1A11337]